MYLFRNRLLLLENQTAAEPLAACKKSVQSETTLRFASLNISRPPVLRCFINRHYPHRSCVFRPNSPRFYNLIVSDIPEKRHVMTRRNYVILRQYARCGTPPAAFTAMAQTAYIMAPLKEVGLDFEGLCQVK